MVFVVEWQQPTYPEYSKLNKNEEIVCTSWVVAKKTSTSTDASRNRKKYTAVMHSISFCFAAAFHSPN